MHGLASLNALPIGTCTSEDSTIYSMLSKRRVHVHAGDLNPSRLGVMRSNQMASQPNANKNLGKLSIVQYNLFNITIFILAYPSSLPLSHNCIYPAKCIRVSVSTFISTHLSFYLSYFLSFNLSVFIFSYVYRLQYEYILLSESTYISISLQPPIYNKKYLFTIYPPTIPPFYLSIPTKVPNYHPIYLHVYYLCIYIYVYMCISMYVCMHVFMYVCMYVCMYVSRLSIYLFLFIYLFSVFLPYHSHNVCIPYFRLQPFAICLFPSTVCSSIFPLSICLFFHFCFIK